MVDHEELVREISLVQQMSVEQRLEHARLRRNQQIAKWRVYENQMASKSDTPHYAEKLHYPDEILLLDATQRKDIDEVRSLLNSGIPPDIPNHDGFTAVHQSSIDGTDDILRLLIKHGANVNCADENGWTPLHAAVACGRISIIRILLENGADLLALNNEMTFPYDMSDDSEVLSVLDEEVKKRGITSEMIQQKRNLPEQQYLKFLKEGGLDDSSLVLQKIDSSDATHLHFAAAYNFCQVAKYLLDIGAAVDSLDNTLWTPLHVACYFSQQNVAQILLEHDADPERLTDGGYSAYDLCGDVEMREWLIQFVLFLNQCDVQRRRSTLPVNLLAPTGEMRFRRGSPRRSSLRDTRKIRRHNDDFTLVLAARENIHDEGSAVLEAAKLKKEDTSANDNVQNASIVVPNDNQTNSLISLNIEDEFVSKDDKEILIENDVMNRFELSSSPESHHKRRRGWFRCCSIL